MQPGFRLRVYVDPISEEEVEGVARLVKKVKNAGTYDGRRLELWEVKFNGESRTCHRKILSVLHGRARRGV